MNWSKNNFLRILLAIAVFLFIAWETPVRAQSSEHPQWLVLNNGQTIQGKVTLDGDRYSVQTDSGSRIVIGNDKVNFVADSIEDVYWDKWSRVDSSDASSHLGLFRWCLKKGLLKQAQQQIELVSKLEDLDQQAESLSTMAQEFELAIARNKERIRLAKQREIEKLEIRNLPKLPELEQQGFAAVPSIPDTAIDAEGMPVRSNGKQSKQATIELVGFDEEFKSEEQRRSKPAWVSNRQLDLETRKMPKGTVSFFKRHLERVLIERCASCHDARSLEMPLSRRSFGQTIPRRMSQQNLHFVMEQIDRANPLESTFLRKAGEAHGGQDSPAVLQNEEFMFELRKWTIAVSHDPTKWLMKLSASTTSNEASTVPALVAAPEAIELDAAPQRLAAPHDSLRQTDPYDPAEFNRK